MKDRRQHPRVAGKFKDAEDAAYSEIRKYEAEKAKKEVKDSEKGSQ